MISFEVYARTENAQTWTELETNHSPADHVRDLAFSSPDGKLIAAGADRGAVDIFRVEQGQQG